MSTDKAVQEQDTQLAKDNQEKLTSVLAESIKNKWNQPEKSDLLNGPAALKELPGPMKMNATIKLHSRMAINLFRGRRADKAKELHSIIGAVRFARQVAMIWTASASDDPYADAALIAIEEAYTDATKTMVGKLEEVQGVLDGMTGFTLQRQESVDPVTVELNFVSPWGYRASKLVMEFDELVRLCLTAKHLGLFFDDDWRNVVHVSSRSIRNMFEQVGRWSLTGVKRHNLRNDDKTASEAKLIYANKTRVNHLDADVLSGVRRAKLSPRSLLLVAHEEFLAREVLSATKIDEDGRDAGASETTEHEQ